MIYSDCLGGVMDDVLSIDLSVRRDRASGFQPLSFHVLMLLPHIVLVVFEREPHKMIGWPSRHVIQASCRRSILLGGGTRKRRYKEDIRMTVPFVVDMY